MPPTPETSRADYRIFGRTIRVEFDDSLGSRILHEELSRYPSASEATPDLLVRCRPPEPATLGLVNPRTHEEVDGGFTARYPTASVRFHMDDSGLREIDFYPARSPSVWMRRARRLRDIQYTTREERAGVIFHERVMVPATYWMPNLALAHASAVADADGGVTLVSGVGGVGKTSLQIELCLHHGFRFVADDISVIDQDGHVWPNLAYPKIYAYNLEDSPDLAGRVLGERNLGDRLHWFMHRQRGPAFVRRRLAPDQLYGTFSQLGGPLRRMVILAREERATLEVAEIDAARAAALSVAVMETEQCAFHNHLHWHAFNRLVLGHTPLLSLQETRDRWTACLTAAFSKVQCLVVRVPRKMDHKEFKHQVAGMIVRGFPRTA